MNAARWSDHLRALAEPVLAGTPLLGGGQVLDIRSFMDGFADEHGHRRAIDRPLLARLLGVDPGEDPEAAATDLRLWWALHTGEPVGDLVHPGPGPILGEAAFGSGAIEITTETELGALHALWHHGEREAAGGSRATLERCLDAARWHISTLQPDNGTNHPWAVHVFVKLAESTGDRVRSCEAALHAETLVHNACVMGGRPDRFSACLLLDAARVLSGSTTPAGDGSP